MADHAASNAAGSAPNGDARRSTRITRAVPLSVSGQDKTGQRFRERTSTVALSVHGCRYHSRHEPPFGSWVTLEVSSDEYNGDPQPVRAQVKSIRLPRNTHELYQIGVELETPDNVWGIPSPPSDWLRYATPARAASQAAIATAPLAEPVEPAHLASSSTVGPRPVTSTSPPEPAKTTRVVIPADRLLVALEGKLQQAAQKAVESAAAAYLNGVVERATRSIEDASAASIRQLEERLAQKQEKLVALAREQLLAHINTELSRPRAHSQERLEVHRTQGEETATRLEKLVAEAQQTLARTKGLYEEATRDLENQIPGRLREAVDRAAADFTHQAVQISDRQLMRLTEKGQAAASEAAARLEARIAEANSQLGTAVNTALQEFQRRLAVELDLAVAETRQQVESSLAATHAAHRADWDTQCQALQDDLTRTAEQFRQRLESISNSWMLDAITAINQHSKAVLDSLTKEAAQRQQQSGRGSTSR